jgi:hypothetical protein
MRKAENKEKILTTPVKFASLISNEIFNGAGGKARNKHGIFFLATDPHRNTQTFSLRGIKRKRIPY